MYRYRLPTVSVSAIQEVNQGIYYMERSSQKKSRIELHGELPFWPFVLEVWGKLPERAKAVYPVLIYHSDFGTLQSYPSLRTIGKEAGFSKSTAHRATEDLQSAGMIFKTKGDTEKTNRYTIAKYPPKAMQPENVPPERNNPSHPEETTCPVQEKQTAFHPEGTELALSLNQHQRASTKLTGNSFFPSVRDIKNLVDTHIELCPVANERHRQKLTSQCRDLLIELQTANQEAPISLLWQTIDRFSHKARKGDGWGIILEAIRKGWTESKVRETAFDANQVKDRQGHPKQPAQGKGNPMFKSVPKAPDENRTKAECNRQVQAVLAAEKEKY